MVEDGHRVFVFAPGALFGGMYDDPQGRTIVGAQYGDDRWGNGTLPYHLQWIQPDVVITWLDPQGLGNYGWTEHPLFIWAPIDTWPIPQFEMSVYGRAEKIVVCSEWGQKVLKKQGIDAPFIPCGIDLQALNIDPSGRKRWREQLKPGITDDTFLIGSVGLNVGSPDRKAYGFQFDAIKKFSEKHKDIRVYIHTNIEGDGGAINLYELRKELELEDVVCFSRPQFGFGEADLYVRDMYNAFDVLLHCGMAEGFGLPVIEAQACGTPVVANACTAMTEMLGPGSVACAPLTDMIVSTSTRIALPSVSNLVEGLEKAYARWKEGGQSRSRIRENALRYERDSIYDEKWRPFLENIPKPIKLRGEGSRKLVLAAGTKMQEGHTHHDLKKFHDGIDVAHDLNVFPYPWKDNSWDYIEFSDCLEHLRANYIEVMDELWRILSPEGHLFVHTAEQATWQLYTDPTHIQGFALNSMDYLDPETRHGQEYSYSDRKWKLLKRTIDESGLCFILTPRKEPVKVRRKREKVTA